MLDGRSAISLREERAGADVGPVACPRCAARLPFARGRTAHIDECGFESYSFVCAQCSVALGGVIDPADDALLLAELPA